MSITLISSTEVRELLGQLEVVQINGVAYVSAEELAGRIYKLCRAGAPATTAEAAPAPTVVGILDATLEQRRAEAMAAPDPEQMARAAVDETLSELEQERARLAALPLGPCAACTCPTKIEHADGRCVECDCMPYIDSTERDPIVTLAARGIATQQDAEIAPAVSMFDVAAMGLDTSREPSSRRFVG